MGKDSSPTSSHFPVTRRYSSSMTHHILEKVWYESSQAHKCGEKAILDQHSAMLSQIHHHLGISPPPPQEPHP
ncbi:hypothetical protein AAG906_005912 [Vitis piasezkii]|uniref:Uncharacterized protein n=1 Tax=Vitis vinifera TaxID=29760 RepID=A0A438GCB0_VITVI|nr:hypothetical protein CK203_061154 [Vitis vinifera]